jgi:hypothetical protein
LDYVWVPMLWVTEWDYVWAKEWGLEWAQAWDKERGDE